MNCKVSIVIPTYNSSKYIERTLSSVICQTYKNYEVIIIDDCSTDDTIDKVEKIIKENRNIDIYLIRKKINSGVAVSRNIGINLSKGRYIAFLDSDDIWKNDKLEKQLNFITKYEYGFVYNAIEIIDENDNIIKNKRKVNKIVKYETLLKKTVISTSSVILDKEKVGFFQMPLLRSGQDYATWLIILRKLNAYGIDEALTQYRKTNGSLSSNKFKSIKQVFTIQRNQENIGIFKASYNTIFFVINAFIKHFFK